MADTVKKSRIVSDEEENLEAALLEEFNTRLKHCMSKDDLQEMADNYAEDDDTFENNPNLSNTVKPFSRNGLATNDFLRHERQQYYDVPALKNGASNQNSHNIETDEEENIYETLPEPEKTESTDQFVAETPPTLNLNLDLSPKIDVDSPNDEPHTFTQLKTPEESGKSVKDRMFLMTDDVAATLLFTQTVTSPMLTPSEENIDFLKGFQRESTNSEESNSNGSPQKDEGAKSDVSQAFPEIIPQAEKKDTIYENVNSNSVNQNSPENIYENLKEPIEENIYENLKDIKDKVRNAEIDRFKDHIYQEIDEYPHKGYENFQILNKTDDSKEELIVDNCLYNKFEEVSPQNGDLITDLDATDDAGEAKSSPIERNYEEIKEIMETEIKQKENHHFEEYESFNTEECIDSKTNESYSEFLYHSKTESNYYEKYTEVVSKNVEINNREKDTETVPAEIVKQLKSQFSKAMPDVINTTKKEMDDVGQLKMVNIIKQINKFEHKDAIGDTLDDDSTVTESYTETTTIQSDTPKEKVLKKKKTKKSRKEEKENISVKSSFSKFDALQKKNVLHIRSSDSAKAQEKFSGTQIDMTNCKACSKQVFQMEQMKAEKAIWHKNCFRCTECSKQLTVETYVSHEGNLYCKPHFKSLFAPKVVEDDTPSSDKPDLGLEELQSLNVKERFQVFEQYQSETQDLDRGPVNVKKSPSILSKLARFQAKGMDVGVSNEALNGIPIVETSSEEEEEEEVPDGEDPTLFRAKKVQKEKPFHFTNLNEVKNKWEHGEQNSKDERREERKQEIQSIRNKLFLGKQGKMKEAYQQAVMQSESSTNIPKSEKIESCDTKSLKERFEKGDMLTEREQRNGEEDDNEVFQSEISKNSRSLFLELDANASKQPQSISPVAVPKLDVKKARESDTPDREIYRDPEVVRSEDTVDDSEVAKASHTASKMLSKFRQMEENLTRDPEPVGPKPLKRFTPPPEPTRTETESDEETASDEENEEVEETDIQKLPEDLIEAQNAARAKYLRAKFEKWEAQEIKKDQNQSVNIIEEYGDESQVESTKSLRARFESMRETSSDKNRTSRVKVNRFVELPNITEVCEGCEEKVYPLEKITVHGHIYHKKCFKCMECSTILRMDSYSYNQGLLYCIPHFKRLFISKGNYDTAFGLNQHKEKWNVNAMMA